MSHRSRPAAAIASLTLLLTACGAPAGVEDGPAAPVEAPSAVGTVPVTDPSAGLTEVAWLETFDPFGEADLAWSEADDWPALFAALPRPTTGDPFSVTMTLERDPDPCTLWHRVPTALDMGPGEAAARMAATVLATLDAPEHAVGPLLAPGEASWCEGRTRETLAFLATDLSPTFCAGAEGREVRCVTVTTFRYDGGAHANTTHTDLVFDVVTGERLGAADLLGPLGVELAAVDAHVEELVCELDRAEGLLAPIDECWEVAVRNVRPMPTGLLFSFSPYESGPYVFGARDLFVPLEVLAAGPLVPAAVRATQQALTDAVRAQDWDAIAALLPADGRFTAGFGAPDDAIAYYRGLARDPLAEWLVVLTQPAGRVQELTVWPELHARDPFVIGDGERDRLSAAFGEEFLRTWEQAGAYLGWRAGFDADGTWRFMVAGD
jgi:hypothetical protein